MNIVSENIDYSLHTHSVGFDGRDSVDNMVKVARANGIKTLGFSNHFIVHPYIKKSPMYNYAKNLGYENIYSDNVDKTIEMFLKHYQEVRDARQKNPDMDILCGMEMDLFKNWWCIDAANYAVRVLEPDYVIGAHHFLEWYDGRLMNIHDIMYGDTEETGHMLRKYYQFFDDDFVDLIKRNLKFDVNFFAHIDLPRKVGAYNPVMEKYAVEKLAKIGIPLELNSSLIQSEDYGAKSKEKPVFEAMAKTNVPVLFSDDAHGIAGIKKGAEAVFDMAQKSNIKNICTKSADLPRFIHLKSR